MAKREHRPEHAEWLRKLANIYTTGEKPVDINAQDRFGTTLLHLVAYHDDAVAIDVLLNNGAKVNIKDAEGDLPINTAVKFGNVKSYKALLDKSIIERHLTKYIDYYNSLEMVYFSDIGDLNRLHKVIRAVPKEKEDFAEHLLLKHHVNFEKDEASMVSTTVYDLIRRICEKVSAMDVLFRTSVIQSGSSAEGTKVGRPDEFDFVLCQDTLNNACNIEMSSYPELEHCACLKFKDEVLEEFLPFSDEEHFFVSQPYLNLLFRYIRKALFDRSLWEDGGLLIRGNPDSLNFKAPVMNFQVIWNGSKYKHLNISVDLVPAVYKVGWWPPRYLPEKVDENVKLAGCLILLQSMSMTKNLQLNQSVLEDSMAKVFLDEWRGIQFKHYKRSYRISVAPAEIALMRSLPASFRKAYALAKMFRSDKFTPILVVDWPLKLFRDRMIYVNGEFVHPAEDIKSYWLKNCVFYVAQDTGNGEKLESASPFAITVEVYRKLLAYAEAGVFRPFLQKSTNLFRFQQAGEFRDQFDTPVHVSNREALRLEFLKRKMSIQMVISVLRCNIQSKNLAKWLDSCEENYWKEEQRTAAFMSI